MKAAALLAVLADGRAMVVPRDDRTGEAGPQILAHERCHARGGSEQECRPSPGATTA